MFRTTLVLLCLMCSVLTVTRAQDRPVLQSEEAQAAWRDDLQVLYARMQAMHPNLFWRTPQSDFEKAVATLDAAIPYDTDEQIEVGLMHIVALVDGHTQIDIFQPALKFHLYGLRLYRFSDGMYVVDAQPPYKEAIGKKLVAVGGIAVESVYEKAAGVAPHDNDTMLQLTTAFYMVVPEVLHGLGITTDVNQPAFVVEDAAGQRMTVNPKPLTLESYLQWGNGQFITLPPNPNVLYLQHQYDQAFWYTYLTPSKTLYIQYNAVARTTGADQTMQHFADDIKAFVDTTPIERTIVDLRHNTGGDNHFYPPLLKLLQTNTAINRSGRLYVVIGRMTLSAAVNFATELEQTVHPIFVGEPTGEPPNLYADARPLVLPHSKIQANISSVYWRKSTADDARFAINPAITAVLSSSDYFHDRDPALDVIFKDDSG